MTRHRLERSPYALWIVVSSWLVASGWILSSIRQLNVWGYSVSLLLLGAFMVFSPICKNTLGMKFPIRFGRLRHRFRKSIPLIYLVYLLGALIGGALYAPSNYDAICYRLPRILHWFAEGRWIWIGGWNERMDYTATGMEWLMAPLIMLLRTDRLLFLINVISYALLPGLIYSAFTGLGISRRVAWYWMWILPTAYCFVLQAGSIGNDCLAAVYLLAAVAFALRAVKSGRWSDAALAFLSAALLTGSKACNLPLLLPLVLVMFPLWRILILKPTSSLMVCVVAVVISFLPIAVSNIIHKGDWSGDPFNKEKIKLTHPVSGILGNSLQALVAEVAPPVLPNAKSISEKTEKLITETPLREIRTHFPRMVLWFGEIPTEEGAGLGLGVTFLILMLLLGGLLLGVGNIASMRAMIFGLLAWISLVAFMAKMGSESTARLIAPYYVVIMIPLLAVSGQERLVRSRWWRALAMVCMLMAMIPMFLSPGRPLLPVNFMLSCATHIHPLAGITERMQRVYSVYGNRSDSLAEVRAHLPSGIKVIGFAGTGNESEYSLWKPFGGVRVMDLNPVEGKIPDLKGVEVIVGSEWGIDDRYHMKAAEFASLIGGEIIWQGRIATMAGREPMMWYVILPDRVGASKPGGSHS